MLDSVKKSVTLETRFGEKGNYIKRKAQMIYSHIFKARKESGYKFICYITATPALQGAPIESAYFDSKVAAKKWAAAKNTKAWNY
jgi:hypothetical protein